MAGRKIAENTRESDEAKKGKERVPTGWRESERVRKEKINLKATEMDGKGTPLHPSSVIRKINILKKKQRKLKITT